MKTRIAGGQNGEQVVMFWCPGCDEAHGPRVARDATKPQQSLWTWNGDRDKPTFNPSLLVRSGHYDTSHKPGQPCWCTYNKEHHDAPHPFTCTHCHSFIRDGNIQFLNDCSHKLRGQTVPIPDWPYDDSDS